MWILFMMILLIMYSKFISSVETQYNSQRVVILTSDLNQTTVVSNDGLFDKDIGICHFPEYSVHYDHTSLRKTCKRSCWRKRTISWVWNQTRISRTRTKICIRKANPISGFGDNADLRQNALSQYFVFLSRWENTQMRTTTTVENKLPRTA